MRRSSNYKCINLEVDFLQTAALRSLIAVKVVAKTTRAKLKKEINDRTMFSIILKKLLPRNNWVVVRTKRYCPVVVLCTHVRVSLTTYTPHRICINIIDIVTVIPIVFVFISRVALIGNKTHTHRSVAIIIVRNPDEYPKPLVKLTTCLMKVSLQNSFWSGLKMPMKQWRAGMNRAVMYMRSTRAREKR